MITFNVFEQVFLVQQKSYASLFMPFHDWFLTWQPYNIIQNL